MHLVYINESGNTGNNLVDLHQPLLILGALVISEDVWLKLENALTARLSAFFGGLVPEGFELHATDLRSGREFFKGFDVNERVKLRDDCFDIVQQFGAKFIYRAIDKKKYKAWHDKTCGTALQINPYLPAFMLLANVVNSYLRAQPGSPRGILVSDENKEIAKDIEKSARALRLIDSHLKLDQIIEKSFFIDSSQSLPLQLCDLCTLSIRKIEERAIGLKTTEADQSALPHLQPLIYRGAETWDAVAWIVEKQQKEKKRPGI